MNIRMRGAFVFLMVIASLTITAQTQDTTDLGGYVITGTRFQTPVEKSGKTIYKIDQEAIQQSGGRTLADLLNLVPAVQIDGNFGTPGTNMEYYIRGARSKYTLVLIDGVPMNDPTGISLFYDLRYLPIEQVESIEVLKGGLSTLYGSNAAAGVINVKLKDNSNKKLGGSLDVSASSFNGFSIGVNASGTSGQFDYGVTLNRQSFDGFSAAQEIDPAENFDDDGFERTNFMFKGGFRGNSNFSLDINAAYDEYQADIDAFAFTDDLTAFADYQQFRIGAKPTIQHRMGESSLGITYIKNERVFESAFPSAFEGQNLQIDQSNKVEIGEFARALFGVNLQYLNDKSNDPSADFTIVDPYASVVFESEDGLNLHVGLRLNTHSDYGNKLLTTINPSWLVNLDEKNRIKPFLSISSAYNTPSLFQLNNPFFGNQELQPEETNNYELGTSFYSGDRLTINAAFFRRDELNAIDFLSQFDENGFFIGGQYINLNTRREVQGLELDGSWQVHNTVTFLANYSKLATNNDVLFARIPKLKYGFGITYQPWSHASLSLKYSHTGERLASPFGTDILEAFNLVDLSIRKRFLNEQLSVYGAINNIFDEEFVGVVGFTTMGRNYNFGLVFDF